MDSPTAKIFDASRCPLCGGANDCQLCTADAYKGPCWCFRAKTEDLLAQVPADLRNKARICRACATKFHRAKASQGATPKILPGDFYFDGGLIVFTAAFHLRRDYCCGSSCRHCPYPAAKCVSPAFPA
jgi:hypothetical protein